MHRVLAAPGDEVSAVGTCPRCSGAAQTSPKAFPALLVSPPPGVPERQGSGKRENVVPALATTNDTMKKNCYSELLNFSFKLRLEGKKKRKDPPPNCFGWLVALLHSLCSTEFGGIFVFLKGNLSSHKSPTQNSLKNGPEGGVGLVMARHRVKKKSELSSDAFKASPEPPF